MTKRQVTGYFPILVPVIVLCVTNITNVAVVRICDVGKTAAPLNERSNIWYRDNLKSMQSY
jgi:hypothetical protein